MVMVYVIDELVVNDVFIIKCWIILMIFYDND